MINNLGSKALETKIDDYLEEYVSDYVSTYMSISEDQIETNRKVLEAGFEDFVVPAYEAAPYTTIQNRAQVTRSLKAVAGVERVMVRSISRLQNEFGSSGQQVWESANKDARVRFVGSGWYTSSNNQGSRPVTITLNDYVEITFYGTGLNVLVNVGASQDMRATIDNGSEGTNFIPTTISNVLDARNYGTNTRFNVASGLSLGWHTVKIRHATTTGLPFYGFDILNDRSDLAVYSGQGIANGHLNSLSALATSSFNSGVVGTRGARVVKYIENGIINTTVTEVNAAAAYLTSADHTNEEVVRRINFREFGAGRADDFSTLTVTGSSRVFTLDDGITTLVGNSVNTTVASSLEIFATTIASGFWTFTFVGTGLDLIESYASPSSTIDSATFFVDNVSVGTVTSGVTGIRKVCSGLAYGTHTVKMVRNAVTTTSLSVSDFIIYQPKKPVVPMTGFEVADYNVMANYAIAANAAVGTVPTGVMRKFGCREVVYSGTWVTPAIDIASFNGGLNIRTVTTGGYVEYSFWGTGIEFRTFFNTATVYSQTYSIDGSTNLSAYTAALITASTGVSFTPATGALAGTVVGNNPALVRITGLPLGLHKIKVLSNNTAALYVDAFDIITPIHINDPALKVGSRSVASATKFSPEKVQSNAGPDLSKAKAWVTFGPSQIFSSYNVSAILKGTSNIFDIFFEKSFKNSFYVVAGTATSDVISSGDGYQVDLISRTSSSAKVGMGYNTGISDGNNHTNQTLVYCSIVFFGELSDE